MVTPHKDVPGGPSNSPQESVGLGGTDLAGLSARELREALRLGDFHWQQEALLAEVERRADELLRVSRLAAEAVGTDGELADSSGNVDALVTHCRLLEKEVAALRAVRTIEGER